MSKTLYMYSVISCDEGVFKLDCVYYIYILSFLSITCPYSQYDFMCKSTYLVLSQNNTDLSF